MGDGVGGQRPTRNRADGQMERQPYDVVVTDLRMPGVDGAKLLEMVSARWPQTIRNGA